MVDRKKNSSECLLECWQIFVIIVEYVPMQTRRHILRLGSSWVGTVHGVQAGPLIQKCMVKNLFHNNLYGWIVIIFLYRNISENVFKKVLVPEFKSQRNSSRRRWSMMIVPWAFYICLKHIEEKGMRMIRRSIWSTNYENKGRATPVCLKHHESLPVGRAYSELDLLR